MSFQIDYSALVMGVRLERTLDINILNVKADAIGIG